MQFIGKSASPYCKGASKVVRYDQMVLLLVQWRKSRRTESGELSEALDVGGHKSRSVDESNSQFRNSHRFQLFSVSAWAASILPEHIN